MEELEAGWGEGTLHKNGDNGSRKMEVNSRHLSKEVSISGTLVNTKYEYFCLFFFFGIF